LIGPDHRRLFRLFVWRKQVQKTAPNTGSVQKRIRRDRQVHGDGFFSPVACNQADPRLQGGLWRRQVGRLAQQRDLAAVRDQPEQRPRDHLAARPTQPDQPDQPDDFVAL